MGFADGPSHSPGAFPRVLIVEDDLFFQEALQHALAAEGFDVRVAADRYEASEAMDREDFDAVISDIHMPGDGIALLRHVKSTHPHTPVILMTGMDEGGGRERALAEGAFAFLRKPIEIRKLRTTLQGALRARGGV